MTQGLELAGQWLTDLGTGTGSETEEAGEVGWSKAG